MKTRTLVTVNVTELRTQSETNETAVKAMDGVKKIKIKKIVRIYVMKTYQRSRGITPLILDLGFSRR